MILRWLAIGSLFLMINALVIVLSEDEEEFYGNANSGLPEDELILPPQGKMF